MKVNKIPTGYLFTDKYSKGELETLSIGDYGKSFNIKADFLGFNKEINGVPNVDCMPLSEKWVITLSTQYGCMEKCKFCDVPNIGFGGNASFNDLYDQLKNAINLFPNVSYTERLNIHFARMGEPTYNPAVFEFAEFLASRKMRFQGETKLRCETIHPVLTTMMPKRNKKLGRVLEDWVNLKNIAYNGQAGLQISINSTNDTQRNDMFRNESLSLADISVRLSSFPQPLSRKYCLNFALASNYEVNAEKLRDLFDPEKFMVKITPIHNNNSCRENGIETTEGYHSFSPYKKAEKDLKKVGFDVLIFVPSFDEEDGLVTCGNLILGGSKLVASSSSKLKIKGQEEI